MGWKKGGKITMLTNNTYKLITKKVKKNADRYISFFQCLIQCRSVNPFFEQESTEAECQQMLAHYLESIGYIVHLREPNLAELKKYAGRPGAVDRDFEGRPNLMALSPQSRGFRALLLAGHIDTVSASEANWVAPPFSGIIKDNFIVGRGTVDMKGGIAAMVCALDLLAELRVYPLVSFASVVDEEAGGSGMLALADYLRHCEQLHGGAILGEPTNLAIATLSRGILWAEVTIKGRSGHIEVKQPSWRKGGAVDAIQKALYVVKALKKLNNIWAKQSRKRHPLLPRPCRVEIARIQGGHSPTSFADVCTLTLNIQYLPDERDECGGGGRIKTEIETYLKEIASKDPWLRENPPYIKWIVDADSFELSGDNTIVEIAKEALTRLGERPVLRGVETHTDAGALHEIGKIPVIILGPGQMHLAHQVNEKLGIKEFLKAIAIYAAISLLWTETQTSES
jgi:acetylornithine deacetylase